MGAREKGEGGERESTKGGKFGASSSSLSVCMDVYMLDLKIKCIICWIRIELRVKLVCESYFASRCFSGVNS